VAPLLDGVIAHAKQLSHSYVRVYSNQLFEFLTARIEASLAAITARDTAELLALRFLDAAGRTGVEFLLS
jgi:hypothetical protein